MAYRQQGPDCMEGEIERGKEETYHLLIVKPKSLAGCGQLCGQCGVRHLNLTLRKMWTKINYIPGLGCLGRKYNLYKVGHFDC